MCMKAEGGLSRRVVGLVLGVTLVHGAALSATTILDAAKNPLLVSTFYGRASRLAGQAAANGSLGVNVGWGYGATSWYVEEQRYGADVYQAGLVTNNAASQSLGWSELGWASQYQVYDPTVNAYSYGLANATGYPFQRTGDPFHSTSLYVEGLARAVLLGQLAGSPGPSAALLSAERGAAWLIEPAVESKGINDDAPYTHRRWVLAATLGMAASIATDPNFKASAFQEAAKFANLGLVAQLPNGVNPEIGGYDVAYQPFGITMAERYYTVCPDPSLRAQVLSNIVRALNWELTKIDGDGNLETDGSSRVGVQAGIDGDLKVVDYRWVVQALTLGTQLTGDPKYAAAATLVAQNLVWLPVTNAITNFSVGYIGDPDWSAPSSVTMETDGVDRPVESDGTKPAYAGEFVFQGSGSDVYATVGLIGSNITADMTGGLEFYGKATLTNAAGATLPIKPGYLRIELREKKSSATTYRIDSTDVASQVSSTWSQLRLPFAAMKTSDGSSTPIQFHIIDQYAFHVNIPSGDKLTVKVDSLKFYANAMSGKPVKRP